MRIRSDSGREKCHSQNYGTVGGFLAVTMAENANLLRGVFMCREYPQTCSAGMHSLKKPQIVPTHG